VSRFNFTLKHIPGTKMGKVDRLSRRPDWKVGIEKDNDNQVFIKDHWICNLYEVIVEGPDINILEKIRIARNKDEEVVRIVEEIKKAEVKVVREEEWQIERELVLKENKMYVLKNEALRVEIIWLYYNIPVVGYRGKWKITELVTRNYWWPVVMRDVVKYMEECDMCQKMKNRMEVSARKLKLSKVPKKP